MIADIDSQLRQLAARTRIRPRTVELARLVLVGGMSQSAAAKAMNIRHRQHAHRAVNIVKRALTEGGKCAICGAAKNKEEKAWQ